MPILLKNQFNNSREDILEVETPEPLTPKHVTVPHKFFVEEAEKNFVGKGLDIKEEKYFLSRDKMKYAGVYILDRKLNEPTEALNEQHNPDLMLSFVNSNDKTMSAGVFFGTHMPSCTNVGWWDSFWIKRRHIGSVMEDLSISIKSFFDNLENNILGYNQLMDHYKETSIDDLTAKGIIVEGAKEKVIPSSKILPVVKEWDKPSFEYDNNEKNLYRLHNSFTTVMRCYKHNPIVSPKRSFKLMNVLNSYKSF